MSESDDTSDSDTRLNRIEALRGLTRDEHAGAALTAPESRTDMPSFSPAPRMPIQRASSLRAFWRRWGGFALVIVAMVVIFGTVARAVLKNSALPFGPKPAPALTVSKVVALQDAGTLACPSDLTWSPDGKQFAIVAVVGASPDGCIPDKSVTNIQSDSVTRTGPQPTAYALAIFDATTDHAVRTIKLPELTTSLLCAGTNPCVADPLSDQVGVDTPSVQSIGWSPDGHTIGVFFTYTFNYGDFIHYENRGTLIAVPVNGSGAPRAFIAKARVRTSSNNITVDNVYGAERFTWDLTTGMGSYADIHRGEWPWTAPFSNSYRLDDTGALSPAQQWRAGDVSPWSA